MACLLKLSTVMLYILMRIRFFDLEVTRNPSFRISLIVVYHLELSANYLRGQYSVLGSVLCTLNNVTSII